MQIVILPVRRLFRIQSAHQAHCDLGRFLHHIAELAGDLRFSAALILHGLDKKNVAAPLRPGKPCDDTRLLLLQDALMADRLAVEILRKLFRAHGQVLFLAFYQLHRRIAAQRIHPLFQAADAGFHGIITDHGRERLIRDL